MLSQQQNKLLKETMKDYNRMPVDAGWLKLDGICCTMFLVMFDETCSFFVLLKEAILRSWVYVSPIDAE